MGNCWTDKQSRQLDSPTNLYKEPVLIQSTIQKISVDQRHSFMDSYEYMNQNAFKKKIYDWKSIPIITQIQFQAKTSFQVKNIGIKQSNFVVGVIKRSAINMQISLPWKTHYCICFQSHATAGQSGIIYDGKIQKVEGEGIKQGETIKVIIGIQDIQWRTNKKKIGSFKIPLGFKNDEILPYVALFNPGDSVEFISQVEIISQKTKL